MSLAIVIMKQFKNLLKYGAVVGDDGNKQRITIPNIAGSHGIVVDLMGVRLRYSWIWFYNSAVRELINGRT